MRIAKEPYVFSTKCKESVQRGPSPELSGQQRRLLLRTVVRL